MVCMGVCERERGEQTAAAAADPLFFFFSGPLGMRTARNGGQPALAGGWEGGREGRRSSRLLHVAVVISQSSARSWIQVS